MAFSPDAFNSAMKKPLGGGAPAPAAKPAPGLDLDSLMGAPGGDNEMGDDAAHEGGETGLQEALEKAGFQPTPDQLSQIKSILGDVGGMIPEMGSPMGEMSGSEDEALTSKAPPAPAKPASKLGKMLGK